MSGGMLLCMLAVAFLAVVLVLPATGRELSWYQVQHARLSSLGCLHTALFAADDRFRAALQPWQWFLDASGAITFVLFLVWMGFTGILGAVVRGRLRPRGLLV